MPPARQSDLILLNKAPLAQASCAGSLPPKYLLGRVCSFFGTSISAANASHVRRSACLGPSPLACVSSNLASLARAGKGEPDGSVGGAMLAGRADAAIAALAGFTAQKAPRLGHQSREDQEAKAEQTRAGSGAGRGGKIPDDLVQVVDAIDNS